MSITNEKFTKENKQEYVSALFTAATRLAVIHEFIMAQGVFCDDDKALLRNKV